jgi:hypothetical protein
MRDEHLGKRWLLMDDADHGRLLHPHDLGFRHGRGCRYAQRLPGQASFAAELVRPQDCDDGFLALLGDNGDFDLALLDIENCIRKTTLREDRLVLWIFRDGSAAVFRVQEDFRVERRLSFAFSTINSLHHSTFPARNLAGPGSGRHKAYETANHCVSNG